VIVGGTRKMENKKGSNVDIHFRINSDLKQKLKLLADNFNMTLSSYIKIVLIKNVKEIENNSKSLFK